MTADNLPTTDPQLIRVWLCKGYRDGTYTQCSFFCEMAEQEYAA